MAKSHRLSFCLLTLPGLIACAFALLVDVVRGESLIGDWGTGQSLILSFGLLLFAGSIAIHSKAIRDEQKGVRQYHRTMIFILIPLFLFTGLPLMLGEVIARVLPIHSEPMAGYQQAEEAFGFSLIPSREYRVVSVPKNFDIRIRIDSNGHRIGNEPIQVEDADVVVLGDSHPFGFGVPEDQTMAMHLEKELKHQGHPSRVLNVGIPGYGLGQTLLKLQSLDSLRAGAVVVVFINPMNDLVNLSASVDYHYSKPHAVLKDGELHFEPSPPPCSESFRFSKPFDTLNQFFGLGQRPKWYRSELANRLARRAVSESADQADFIDQSSAEEFLAADLGRISKQPMLYASRYWTEMPQFSDERKVIAKLAGSVFNEMKSTAETHQWQLIAVVACEGHCWQSYGKNLMQQVENAVPNVKIEAGWSRNTVLDELRKLTIPVVTLDYQTLDADPLFLQNDDHTSSEGHRLLAIATAETLAAIE